MASVSALDIDVSSLIEGPCTQGIRATDPDGFDILAFYDKRGARVCFGGLEQDFDTAEEADVWIKRASSEAYRLRIDLIDRHPIRFALEEILSGGEVREVMVSGYPISKRSKRGEHRIVYRQNHN